MLECGAERGVLLFSALAERRGALGWRGGERSLRKAPAAPEIWRGKEVQGTEGTARPPCPRHWTRGAAFVGFGRAVVVLRLEGRLSSWCGK